MSLGLFFGMLLLILRTRAFPCQRFNWLQKNSSHPRIYDLFLVSTEIDLLEVRLEELAQIVDFHVILESNMTFTGQAKLLAYQRAPTLFQKYKDKIIYILINELHGETAWERERFQRNSLVSGLTSQGKSISKGDIVVVSDVDEIPKPHALAALKFCTGYPHIFKLGCMMFYYSFELQVGYWVKAFAYIFQGEHPNFDIVRRSRASTSFTLPRSCWHCSYCFPRVNDIVRKFASYSHKEFNRFPFNNPQHIFSAVCKGTDVLMKKHMVKKPGISHFPRYLQLNRERFPHLVNRSLPSCGFVDAPIIPQ